MTHHVLPLVVGWLVRWFVRRSVIFPLKGGTLYFYAPIGALVYSRASASPSFASTISPRASFSPLASPRAASSISSLNSCGLTGGGGGGGTAPSSPRVLTPDKELTTSTVAARGRPNTLPDLAVPKVFFTS